MSTERDVSPGTSESTATPPRLTPPPRLTLPSPSDAHRDTVGHPSAATRSAAPRSVATRSLATWLTLAFFGVLVLAAVAVFVVLPDWVRDRQQPQTELARDPAAAQPTGRETMDPESAIEPPMADNPPAAPEPADPPAEVAETATAVNTGPAPPSRPQTAAPARPATAPAWARNRDADRRDFERAMSEGLAALDRQDYTVAGEAFARAAELRPGSPQSADGLARAQAGARLSTISTLREEALAAEGIEDWQGARQRYEAVLEIDPTVEFALDGRARNHRRGELEDRIDFHLANPGRLTEDEVLQEAQALLEQASEIEPPGPGLRQQRERLAGIVATFSTPVTATLESDQLTEVVVYKVGRLGTFSRHALDLRPGTYTVVGSRRGFRDVRRKLVIEPGTAPQPLAIRCEERI